MNNKYRSVNPEVLYSEDAIVMSDKSDIISFKQRSSQNPRKRVRLCTHSSPNDRLHEMLIILERGAYVRPHKHPEKTESTHIIEGLVDVVIFDDVGQIESVFSMGDYASGKTFYYRMAVPVFHTLIIRSDVLVFHETTNGPFDRKDTVFAPWAPDDNDTDSINAFILDLDVRVNLVQ